MGPSRYEPFSKLRAIHSDAKQASYALWFGCKHLTKKMKSDLWVSKIGNVDLPQEIVDHIVDYISDDRPTLFACTHLSRTWCIAARAHLYRTYTVWNFTGFRAVNNLQSTGAVHFVRRLIVAQQIHQADFLSSRTTTYLNAFTQLQDLRIERLNVGGLLTWLHPHYAILNPTVQTLTLRYPRGTAKQLLCFISLFSGLEDLVVERTENETVSDAVVPVPEFSPPLTGRLKMVGIFDQEFMSGLASFRKGLKFRVVNLQFCEGAQKVIDGCVGTMERFVYHPPDFRGTENLDLLLCRSLRHVEVTSRSIIRAFPAHPFRDFISTIPSPQLEICLIMSYDLDLDELRQTLLATPKPEANRASQEKEQTKRDIKITLGLETEKGEAHDHCIAVRTALNCAVVNGVFEFLMSPPVLEVYPRVWNSTA